MVNLVNRDPEGITVKGTMLFLYATDAIYKEITAFSMDMSIAN